MRKTSNACLGLFLTVSLLEALDTTGRVNQLLLAGEERMAGGADLNPVRLAGGTGFHHMPAGTGDINFLIVRMDRLFHVQFPRAHTYNSPLLWQKNAEL